MKRSTPSRGRRCMPVAGLAAAVLAAGCELRPLPPTELTYTLSEASEARLVNEFGAVTARGSEAQILGALEMFFGTPSAPQVLVTEDMEDAEFDPNAAWWTELDEETQGAVIQENRARRFERQLALIEAGRYAEVPEPRWAADLWARWQSELLPKLLEDPDALVDEGDPELGTWKDEAVYAFENHYPTLRESAEMFRQQCLHCHGVDGGGDGPTSPYLYPRPRDYRHGKFKFVAVDRNRPPRRADLLRILQYGVPTTAMPSFARFTRGELEGLIDYVRLLAVRGQTEILLVASTVDAGNFGLLPPDAVLDSYATVWERWLDAESSYVAADVDVPRPEEMTAERVAHGEELFMGNVANCYTCHGVNGRGNGESIWEDDPRGGVTVDEHGEQVAVKRQRLDEWGADLETALGRPLTESEREGFSSNPRNLQMGVFRGGSRPIDLFRKVKYGVGGTIMPAAETSLTNDDLWDVVYYVLSIAEEHDLARLQERKLAHAAEAGHGGADQGTSGH